MKKTFTLLFTLVFLASSIPLTASASKYNFVKVISYAGDVNILKEDSTDTVNCTSGMKFKSGDRIKTGKESYVEMAFDRRQDSIVRVEENSDVVIILKGNDKIELVDGEIIARLRDMPRGQVFQVRTPCVVCGARGTGWGTKTNGQETTVSSFEDKVFVRGINKDGSPMEGDKNVNEGYERKIKKFSKPGKETKMSDEKLNKLKGKIKFPDKKNKRTRKRRRRFIGSKRERHKEDLIEKRDKQRAEKEDKKEEPRSIEHKLEVVTP